MATTTTEIREDPPAPEYSYYDPSSVSKPDATYSSHPQPAYSQEATYVTPLERLRDEPELVDCPFCQRRTRTRVQKEDSSMTYLAGGLLCLVCICLACLPCMLGWAQHLDHYCSACNKQLTHKPHDGMTMVVEGARGIPRGGPRPDQVPSQLPPDQQQQVPLQQYPPQAAQQQSHQGTGHSTTAETSDGIQPTQPISEAPAAPKN